MTYKRTIHCRRCGKAGHNRNSCPEQKAYIARRRELYGDDDFTVRQHDAKKARRAAASKNRTCSYCGSTDHNRRGCPTIKEHMAAYEAMNATYRLSFLKAMLLTGFGPGAMIQTLDWRGNPVGIRVITELDWSKVTFHSRYAPVFKARKPHQLGVSISSWYVNELCIPEIAAGSIETSRLKVLIPATEESIKQAMPIGWLSGAGDTKSVFDDKHSGFNSVKDVPFDLSRWYAEVQGLE